MDCRKIISHVDARRTLMRFGANLLKEAGRFDVVAGGETAGIPFGAWLAEELKAPMVYVRKEAKGFGRKAQIEGELKEGARALLVEDLATDAKSKVKFVEALRKAGAVVEHAFVIFYYGIFPESEKRMEELGVKLHALCTWRNALEASRS